MEIKNLRESLNYSFGAGFDVYERRPGNYQLIVPIRHEDGDMIDIYLQDSPLGDGFIRVCDFGMTLMRLSYTYEITTPARQQIFESLLINNGVSNNAGNLYLDAPVANLYEYILQFVGCAQKVCNMRYWSREITRSVFYDDLKGYVTAEMPQFSPVADRFPLPDFPNSVDWSLVHNHRSFYVFGVLGNDKAKNVTISLLEFQKFNLPFISLVVHENMEDLGKMERLLLTRNADTQYPALTDFMEKGTQDIYRFAGVPP